MLFFSLHPAQMPPFMFFFFFLFLPLLLPFLPLPVAQQKPPSLSFPSTSLHLFLSLPPSLSRLAWHVSGRARCLCEKQYWMFGASSWIKAWTMWQWEELEAAAQLKYTPWECHWSLLRGMGGGGGYDLAPRQSCQSPRRTLNTPPTHGQNTHAHTLTHAANPFTCHG